MNWRIVIILVPLLLSPFISLGVGYYVWRRRAVSGAVPFSLMMLAIAWWGGGYLLQLLAGPNLSAQIGWHIAQRLGTFTITPLLMGVVLDYTDNESRWTRHVLSIFWVWTIAIILLTFTNQWHGLIFPSFAMQESGPLAVLTFQRGWLLQVYVFFVYSLLLLCVYLILRWGRKQTQSFYLYQVILVIACFVFVFICSILFVTDVTVLDLTPFAFALVGVGLAWILLRYHLFDIKPIARDQVIEGSPIGMVVLDGQNKVVDINPAAADIIGIPASQAIGMTARKAFSPWPHLIDRFRDVFEARTIVTFGDGNARTHYEVTLSSLHDKQGEYAGRIIMLRALDESGDISTEREIDSRDAQLEVRVEMGVEPQTPLRIPFLTGLVNFFFPPVRTDLDIPPGEDPNFYTSFERIVTIALRFSAVFSPLVMLFSVRAFAYFPAGYIVLFVVDACLMVLASIRVIPFRVRVNGFLFALYVFGVVEVISFGYSPEGFIIFMLVVVGAGALNEYKSGWIALIASAGVLSVLGWLTVQGYFVPLGIRQAGSLSSQPSNPIPVLIAFVSASAGLNMIIMVIWGSLRQTWQSEKQALRLLQRERDLLDQRVADRAHSLADAEEKYRTLVEQLPVVIYRDMVDTLGTISYISPAVVDLLGYSLDEWYQDPNLWHKLVHPDDYDRAVATIEETLTHGYSIVDYRLLTRDKRVVWVRDTASLVCDHAGQPQYVQGIFSDITEQKQAEDAARVSEEKYRGLFEQTTDAVFILDLQGKYITVNQRAADMLGYSVDEVLDLNVWDVSAEIQQTEHILERVLGGENIPPYERIFRKKSGVLFPVEISVELVRDVQGRPSHIQSVVRDITVRKQTEEALQLQTERLALINELFGALVGSVDPRELCDQTAQRLARTFKYFNVSIFLIDPDTKRLVLQAVRGAYENIPRFVSGQYSQAMGEGMVGQAAQIGQRIVSNDVRETPSFLNLVEINTKSEAVFPMRAGGRVLGVLNIDADVLDAFVEDDIHLLTVVTDELALAVANAQLYVGLEQRVVERTAELQSANAFLESLLTTALIVNSSLDQDEVLDHILRQARTLIPCRAMNIMLIRGDYAFIVRRIGYEGLEQIERDLLERQFPLTWHNFAKMKETGASMYVPDSANDPHWRITTKETEWVRSYLGIPLMMGNELLGFLNASHDEPNFFHLESIAILEGLAKHAAIAIQNARLLNETKAALEKEQTLRTQLVQADKLAALGKMVAVIAHEINNPIQTIKNAFFLLKDQVELDEVSMGFLELAQIEADRIVELVSQLRDAYKPRSKTLTRVNLLTLLTEVSAILLPQLRKSNVEWVQPAECEFCTVLGIRNNLKQVLINLCQNAIEAVEVAGGGKITVEMFSNPDSRLLGISIHNTGPLIPQEAVEHIFDPFYTTKSSGSGLGLYVCYDIVQQHHGYIEVKSAPETGVVFTVWLPLVWNEQETTKE